MPPVPDVAVFAPLRRRIIRWLPLLLLLLAAAVYGAATLMQLADQRLPAAERLLRIDDQAWRKRVRLLKDPQHSVFTDAGYNPRIDTLQVTLVEALDALADTPSVKLLHYGFAEAVQLPVTDGMECSGQAERVCVDDKVPGPVTALRLTLAFQLAHASALLRMLDTLQQRIASHPMEIRGCSLQRLPSALALQAECALDIYHWELSVHAASSNSSESRHASVNYNAAADTPQGGSGQRDEVDHLGSSRLFFSINERQQRDKAGQATRAHTDLAVAGQLAHRTSDTSGSGSQAVPVKAGLQNRQHNSPGQTSIATSAAGVVYTGYVSSGKQLRVLLNGVPWHASSGITWTVDSTEQVARLRVVMPSGREHTLGVGQGTGEEQ